MSIEQNPIERDGRPLRGALILGIILVGVLLFIFVKRDWIGFAWLIPLLLIGSAEFVQHKQRRAWLRFIGSMLFYIWVPLAVIVSVYQWFFSAG